MNKWLFHQNGFTRTSLSATLTRESNSVDENVCFFFCFFFTSSRLPSRCIPSLIAKHVKFVNRNALSMFKALNKGLKQKCAVLLLNQVEGRLKSLKIQLRGFPD